MNPNDLGDSSSINTVAENLTKININDLVRQSNSKLKQNLIRSELEIGGLSIELGASKTGFGGERLWFLCPRCKRRVGVIYRRIGGLIGCRQCLCLRYMKQRFKGMVETDNPISKIG